MLEKHRLVRLKGKAMRELVEQIWRREQYSCAYCHAYIGEGVKPHHEPCGAGRKSDEYNKMIYLCKKCHNARHFGRQEEVNSIKNFCLNYLQKVKS